MSLSQPGDDITVESIQEIVDERIARLLFEMVGSLNDGKLAEVLKDHLPEDAFILEAAKRLEETNE